MARRHKTKKTEIKYINIADAFVFRIYEAFALMMIFKANVRFLRMIKYF
jgi:hypothetical protein